MKFPRWQIGLFTSLAAFVIGTTVMAEDVAPAAKLALSHKIARRTLRHKFEADGVFQSTEMHPLRLTPKAWADITITEAVPHGAQVKKGEPLLKLSLDKLKDHIANLEKDQPATAVALTIAEAELINLTEATPLKLENARRSQRQADENLTYFEKTDRDAMEKTARFTLKSAEQRLANEREELSQLQKMYRADDLTEETEEIILKRQKFAVESAEQGLEFSRLGMSWRLKTGIPRDHDNFKAIKREQDLALQLAEETFPQVLTRKKLEIEKLRRDQAKAEKILADLRTDLETLSARAPADGVVIYGASDNGKWITAGLIANKLATGQKFLPHEVIMTVANPNKLAIQVVAPEREIHWLQEGVTGLAALTANHAQKLAAKVEEISTMPTTGGGFAVTLSFVPTREVRLVPGMTCRVMFISRGEEVVMAPKEAIFVEDFQQRVYVRRDNGKAEIRVVQTGDTDGAFVEILQGLEVGEDIFLQKPQ